MDDRLLWVKELRLVLKADWARLWMTKGEDEVRAEGFSLKDFEKLFVDKGEIIHATRDFKPISFREIFEKHVGSEAAGRVDVDPKAGGWGKFVRENFPSKPARPAKRERPGVKADLSQQQRKDGRGWLNKARIFRKIRNSRNF